MRLLRKALAVTTLTWLPVAVSCATIATSADPLYCVAVGAWRALPAWPVLLAVLLPMMGIGERLAEARTPAPVLVPARRRPVQR